MAESGLSESQARIEVLETQLRVVRERLRELVPKLFQIHLDDLVE